ncbi:MAG: hypothetical protein GY930_15815 [bacterium]|nr:hypothetical protein [bacterium]
MKLIATTLLCSSALLGFGETLETKAGEGDVLTRTYTYASESVLDSMTMLMNGDEHGGMGGGMERESKSSSRLVVRDELGKVEDDVVISAERTYLELSGEREDNVVPPRGDPMDMETTESSELVDKTVVLTSKDDKIVATWAKGSDGEKELLEGLKFAEDFGILLPAEAVEADSTWTIPGSLLSLLAEPIGDTHLVAGDMPEGMDMEALIQPTEELKGELEAKFVEIVEEDGRKFARVELQIEVAGTLDMTDAMAAMQEEDAPEGRAMPKIESMIHEVDYSGEGSFLWDLEGGHLYILEINCETQSKETMTMVLDMGGQEVEMEQISESTGTESWTVKYEMAR